MAGLHFFNPVPLMRLVEVISAPRTAKPVVELLVKLGAQLGHETVHSADQPGFVVNHLGRGFGTEALAILQSGVAEPADIDRLLRDQAEFRMGPFQLYDPTGLDVSLPVLETIHAGFYGEPQWRTALCAHVEAAGRADPRRVGLRRLDRSRPGRGGRPASWAGRVR